MDKKIIIMCKMFDMPSQILFVENNEVKRTLISTELSSLTSSIIIISNSWKVCFKIELRQASIYFPLL